MVSLNQMEIAIANLFDLRKCIIIPRVFGRFTHELDLCIIRRKTSYCVEVEIKRSVSDMKADLKKPHTHSDPNIVELYYAFPSEIIDKCTPLVPEEAGIIEIYKNPYYQFYRA